MPTTIPTAATAPPTPAEIDAIAAVADPAIRNLRITQAYHRMALAFAGDRLGANWCTFATWASRQAGQTIRGEDLLRALERALRNDVELAAIAGRAWRWAIRNALRRPGTRRWRVLRALGDEAFTLAARAVARGNRKVFEEIGREFARFLPLLAQGSVSSEALEAFLSELRPGDSPDGQDRLRRAFTCYAQAARENDPNRRAELLLLANLEIGFHEQTRLQPEILEALEAPYTGSMALGRRLLQAIAPSSSDWYGWARTPAAAVLGGGGRIAEASLRSLLRRLITESMMTLALPGGVLRLGRRLVGEPPECLRNPAHPELVALLTRLTPPPTDVDGTGAADWSALSDRMVLIAALFRLRHEDASLCTPPFTPEQVAAFEEGRLPDGIL
ncbi:MAG TPA: hypothetical protein VFZ18_16025 [Longimicrobiaceae bacterium]